MKMIDKIKSKSLDEFAEWLDRYDSCYRDSPWMNWWNKKYCDNCPSEIGRFEGSNRDVEFCWCELYDKCKFFQDMDKIPNNKEMIKMWLESEGE